MIRPTTSADMAPRKRNASSKKVVVAVVVAVVVVVVGEQEEKEEEKLTPLCAITPFTQSASQNSY
jgi:hypothetical protein